MILSCFYNHLMHLWADMSVLQTDLKIYPAINKFNLLNNGYEHDKTVSRRTVYYYGNVYSQRKLEALNHFSNNGFDARFMTLK